MSENVYPIRGTYVVSQQEIALNSRENKALDQIMRDCEDRVRQDGYPNPKWNEATKIEKFVITTDRSVARWEHSPPTKAIFGRKGNVYVTFDCIHHQADEIETATEEFARILFFPHATTDYDTLNAACLYFDKTYVIFPDESVNTTDINLSGTSVPSKTEYQYFGDRFRFRGDKDEDIRKFVEHVFSFFDKTFPLRREGLLNLISPSEHIGDIFSQAVANDLADSEFDRIVSTHAPPSFILGGSKRMALRSQRETETLTFDDFTASEIGSFVSNTNIDDWEFGDWGFFRVSPQVGASILANHSLLACANRGLLPFTDNSLFFKLLLHKCQRIDQSDPGKAYKRNHGITEALLANRVLEEHVPFLHLKSAEDVLEIRDRHADGLTAFKTAIRILASNVAAVPYTKEFFKEIEEVIARDVNPVVEDLRQEMRELPQKFLRSTLKGLKAGTIPMVAAAFAGLPVPYLLALSAGVVTLETILDLSLEMRKKQPRSGLCFLLRAK